MNEFLSRILKYNPGIFRELDEKTSGIYFFLIEIIMLFFIHDFLKEGKAKTYSSQWIQKEIMDSLNKNKEKLPHRYWEPYSSNTNKIRIKQEIINVTTSNANNNNPKSLGNRKELIQSKNNGKTEYKLSDLIVDNWLKDISLDNYDTKINITLCLYFNFHKNLKTIMNFRQSFCFSCEKLIKNFSLPIIRKIEETDDPLRTISSICINCLNHQGEKVNV